MGQLFKRPLGRASSADKTWRVPNYDEPDCGSCHVGTVRLESGFFSTGARMRAFDEQDPSATPYAVDAKSYDAQRFAVSPVSRGWPLPCAACHGGSHAL